MAPEPSSFLAILSLILFGILCGGAGYGLRLYQEWDRNERRKVVLRDLNKWARLLNVAKTTFEDRPKDKPRDALAEVIKRYGNNEQLAVSRPSPSDGPRSAGQQPGGSAVLRHPTRSSSEQEIA